MAGPFTGVVTESARDDLSFVKGNAVLLKSPVADCSSGSAVAVRGSRQMGRLMEDWLGRTGFRVVAFSAVLGFSTPVAAAADTQRIAPNPEYEASGLHQFWFGKG